MEKKSIGKYLSIAHRAHTSMLDKKFKEKFGISHGQIFILITLYKNEGINQHRLCKIYDLDKGGVGRIIKKLKEKELIIKEADPEDKRNKLIFLTEKARAMKSDFFQILNKIEKQIKQGLTEEEIETFLKIINKICNNLGVKVYN